MAYYIKKPVAVEAITFDEFVQYGIKHAKNLVNGEPWSFNYKNIWVTQENSKCYILPTATVGTFHFTPDHMLVTDDNGVTKAVDIDLFKAQYDPIISETPYLEFTASTPEQLAEKLLKASCSYCIYGQNGCLDCENKSGAHCKDGILSYLLGKTLD